MVIDIWYYSIRQVMILRYMTVKVSLIFHRELTLHAVIYGFSVSYRELLYVVRKVIGICRPIQAVRRSEIIFVLILRIHVPN